MDKTVMNDKMRYTGKMTPEQLAERSTKCAFKKYLKPIQPTEAEIWAKKGTI